MILSLAFFALLAVFVQVDPAHGVTASTSPWTDEGWNVSNARDLVMFGTWATDAWQMWLVNLPFSALQAAWLAISGVGIVQARLLVIAAAACSLAGLGIGLRRSLSSAGAAIAVAALGGSALFLYYGRLAYLEPLVTLWLILAQVALARERASTGAGIVAGIGIALAVATKASAAAAAAGLVVGVAVAGVRDPSTRRAVLAALGTVAILGAVWAVVFALPRTGAVATDLRIWASEPLPRTLPELLVRIRTYAYRSDGGIPLALPLLVGGFAGAVASIARYRSLTPARRRVALGSIGWFVAGMAVLLVVPYRPNRYLVPLLPPLAALAGLGFAVLTAGAAPGRLQGRAAAPLAGAARASTASDPRSVGRDRRRLSLVPFAALALAVALAAPGLELFGRWVATSPSTLPGIQARIALLMPPGSAVQGDLAPILAMRADAVTIVSRPSSGVNAGDLYATRHVRWVLTTGAAPQWAALHPRAWSSRLRELCVSWGPGETCLYRLP